MDLASRICKNLYHFSISAVSNIDTSVISVQHRYTKHVQLSRYDRTASLHTDYNPMYQEHTKHIEVDCHFINEGKYTDEVCMYGRSCCKLSYKKQSPKGCWFMFSPS